MSVIPALRKLRQENLEFKPSLGYIAKLSQKHQKIKEGTIPVSHCGLFGPMNKFLLSKFQACIWRLFIH
jgi:hypothetical protein